MFGMLMCVLHFLSGAHAAIATHKHDRLSAFNPTCSVLTTWARCVRKAALPLLQATGVR